MKLSGKYVLITGVSSGIGRAIAECFLAEGAHVYGVSRRSSNLPEGLTHIQADLTEPEAVQTIFSQIPQLDILVNNAGVAYLSRITDGNPEDWTRMWRLNVQALAECCQAALPLLSSTGCILNISSLSGSRVPPTGGFYAPTKFAVSAITTALRNELVADGKQIRVASLCPGFVDTEILDHYFAGREDELSKTKAKIDMLSPTDVAASALHIVIAPPSVLIEDVKIRSTTQAG